MKAPEDIALISHANKGDPIAYRVPVTILEIDPEQQAEATLRLVEERFKVGHPKANIEVKLLRGLTCGEANEGAEK